MTPKSGPNPSIDKRNAAPALAWTSSHAQPAIPPALSNCAAPTISSACSHLVTGTQTTTVTSTSTCTARPPRRCTSTTTLTTTITTTDRTTTSTTTATVYPVPSFVSGTGVFTTTVPAACASTPYYPSGNGDGNTILYAEGYPYFPQTSIECCALCFQQENCVASAVIYADDEQTLLAECELLIHVNGTQPGPNVQCPLGIQDYDFGAPQSDGNVYPGPCGL